MTISSVKTICPQEISCPCTTLWIFLVYPSSCKNHNSLYKTTIDITIILLDSLRSLVSFLQMLDFLGSQYRSYEFCDVLNMFNTPKTLKLMGIIYITTTATPP